MERCYRWFQCTGLFDCPAGSVLFFFRAICLKCSSFDTSMSIRPYVLCSLYGHFVCEARRKPHLCTFPFSLYTPVCVCVCGVYVCVCVCVCVTVLVCHHVLHLK